MASPMYRHGRSGSAGLSNVKRPQNTKAAARRLAQVMSHQPSDDQDDDEDLYDFEPPVQSVGIGLAGGRQTRNRSPIAVHTSVVQPPSVRVTSNAKASTTASAMEQKSFAHSTSGANASTYVSSVEKKPLSTRTSSSLRSSNFKPVEPSSPAHSSRANHSSQPTELSEDTQSPFAQNNNVGRSSSHLPLLEQSQSADNFVAPGHLNLVVKTAPVVPPTVPIPTKSGISGKATGGQLGNNKDKRLSLDFGTFKYKEPSDQQSSSALQDELDMLQEENDNLLEKLRIAEERCEESEARTRQLEKQIVSLGDGVSLEARLLSRKEADIEKREAALKVAAETYGGGVEEIAALRSEAEAARDEATSVLEQLHGVEHEVKSLRTMTQRMILTQEEMEEVVLKKCWLARCWSLCLCYGIHSELAESRYEYWSSFVSRPAEVILAAGQKAKDENSLVNNDLEERVKVMHDLNEISKKGDVESMLLVEKGLRELNSLKVEEAIAMSMAQKRRTSIIQSNVTEELRLPVDSQNFSEAFELSEEESEDVLLKQAWLVYFWRRARNHGLEPDIAEDRLQFWISQANNKPLNSHDAYDVERCLMELRKLGIETKLWEETRRLVDPDSTQKTLLESES